MGDNDNSTSGYGGYGGSDTDADSSYGGGYDGGYGGGDDDGNDDDGSDTGSYGNDGDSNDDYDGYDDDSNDTSSYSEADDGITADDVSVSPYSSCEDIDDVFDTDLDQTFSAPAYGSSGGCYDSITAECKQAYDSFTTGVSSFALSEAPKTSVVDEISQTIDRVGDTIETGKECVSDFLSQTFDEVSDWASEAKDYVSDTVSKAVDNIGETIEAGYDYVTDTVSQAVDKFGEMVDTGKEYASNTVDQSIAKAGEIADEAKNTAVAVVDSIKEQSTGFWGAVAQKSGVKKANGYVNDAMAWTNRNLMVTDYPGIHQTYQVAKTLGKTFGLVGMTLTGKNLYDDWHNYQGINCAKAMAIDTGALVAGWGVTVGLGAVASYVLAPTAVAGALTFGGSVAIGALITMGAKALKNGIDKVNE